MTAAPRTITPRDAGLDEIAERLRGGGSFIVATHRNPDGDAIGSMFAIARALRNAGSDVVLWHPDVPAVPEDLTFLVSADDAVAHELPADAATRTLLVVDCATEGRLGDRPPAQMGALVINIDHHHDNTRFGDLNYIDGDASSSAEIVLALLDAAGFGLDPQIALALHVGIVTDTGRLSYSKVTGDTLRADGRLVDAGVDVAETARRLYENLPLPQARLLGMAYTRAQSLLSGRLLVAVLDLDDFATAGSDDADGIAEALRAVRGVEVGALVRHVHGGGLRASLRAASDLVDVSAIARAEGGGGHRAAAGLTSHKPEDEFVAWLTDQVDGQLNG